MPAPSADPSPSSVSRPNNAGGRHPIGWPAILTCGFAAAIGLWTLWFITHLPWIGLPESTSVLILLGYWLLAAAVVGATTGHTRPVRVGMLSGVVTALIGLLILGTKLRDPAASSGSAGAFKPAAPLIAAGFLALGAAIGGLGGLAGRVLASHRAAQPASAESGADSESADVSWTRRFSLVTVAAMLPLLVIGGLVTSTDSGMAVPDWPNTFGTNMFLYPLGPRAAADVYLEHSHRLFGTLVGLAAIVLAVLVWRTESRRWVRNWAIALLLLIILQGVLGGIRVRVGTILAAQPGGSFDRWYAFAHGVLGQLVLAWGVALAAFLSIGFRVPLTDPPAIARRIRGLATGAMHATILQLIFGGMYRHTRSSHALWTHAGFATIVFILALVAGFLTLRLRGDTPFERSVRRGGTATVIVVVIQFLLGWVTFAFGGKLHDPESLAQALLRTSHQFNGAILLALVTWTAMVARRAASASPDKDLRTAARNQAATA